MAAMKNARKKAYIVCLIAKKIIIAIVIAVAVSKAYFVVSFLSFLFSYISAIDAAMYIDATAPIMIDIIAKKIFNPNANIVFSYLPGYPGL